MKSIKLLFLSVLSAYSLLSCNENDSSDNTKTSADLSLTPVYVESGTIDSLAFKPNGAFSASDNAIGRIDTCKNLSFNGFRSLDNWVYVFENEGEFKKNAEKISVLLAKATWKEDNVYKLPFDAEFCFSQQKYLYYVREKGEYKRQKATLSGTTVYRFKDEYVVEDYSNLLDYHEYIRPKAKAASLYEYLKVSSEQYSVSTNRKDLVIDPTSGLIDFEKSTTTPKGEIDLIYLRHKSGFPVYRLRHLYFKYSKEEYAMFFGKVGSDRVLPLLQGRWGSQPLGDEKKKFRSFLNEKAAQYLKPVIRGYTCEPCNNSLSKTTNSQAAMSMAAEGGGGGGSEDGPPPLPKISGGF